MGKLKYELTSLTLFARPKFGHTNALNPVKLCNTFNLKSWLVHLVEKGRFVLQAILMIFVIVPLHS